MRPTLTSPSPIYCDQDRGCWETGTGESLCYFGSSLSWHPSLVYAQKNEPLEKTNIFVPSNKEKDQCVWQQTTTQKQVPCKSSLCRFMYRAVQLRRLARGMCFLCLCVCRDLSTNSAPECHNAFCHILSYRGILKCKMCFNLWWSHRNNNVRSCRTVFLWSVRWIRKVL